MKKTILALILASALVLLASCNNDPVERPKKYVITIQNDSGSDIYFGGSGDYLLPIKDGANSEALRIDGSYSFEFYKVDEYITTLGKNNRPQDVPKLGPKVSYNLVVASQDITLSVTESAGSLVISKL